MYNYAYLTGALIILPVWLILFFFGAKGRKGMISVGLYVAFLAIPLEFIWFLKDYWYPLKYVSASMFVSQELIFGFFVGGIVSVIFSDKNNKKSKENFNVIRFLIPLGVLFSSMIVFSNLIGFNSIYACDIGFAITACMILYLEPDLIKKSFISGFLMVATSVIGYLILLTIYPNIVRDWWLLRNISGILAFGIPIEEILFFLLFGLSFGPIYNFWQETQ
ncbi:MAG: lycopene cyclase domain-containing protein [Candidatus Moranbacteria bacterium]|nr:lycopene cyclase domain-containing protein [Candidatus Moranbacteria bacterium]